ncbi:MAG: response regulator [Elainellaceae cyanobacterium]
MSIHPDIRDQAYQFFVEEAPELLDILEDGLLNLREERNTAKVHSLMRAAHSLKGSSASVGLDTIKSIAHRLESILKALYSDKVEIDVNLETLLLQAYDSLKLPLIEQISVGTYDKEEAIARADDIFVILEDLLSEALERADDYLPSSSDLGVDMVASIFEVDVEQGIERLQEACQHSDSGVILSEVEAQAEVFEGIAELLNLSGFGSIAQTTRQALSRAPDQALQIAQLCLKDFQESRAQVIAGKRSGEGAPCDALVTLATGQAPSHNPELMESNELDPLSNLHELGSSEFAETDFAEAGFAETDLENFDDFSDLIGLDELNDLHGLEGLDELNETDAAFDESALSDDDFAAALATALQPESDNAQDVEIPEVENRHASAHNSGAHNSGAHDSDTRHSDANDIGFGADLSFDTDLNFDIDDVDDTNVTAVESAMQDEPALLDEDDLAIDLFGVEPNLATDSAIDSPLLEADAGVAAGTPEMQDENAWISELFGSASDTPPASPLVDDLSDGDRRDQPPRREAEAIAPKPSVSSPQAQAKQAQTRQAQTNTTRAKQAQAKQAQAKQAQANATRANAQPPAPANSGKAAQPKQAPLDARSGQVSGRSPQATPAQATSGQATPAQAKATQAKATQAKAIQAEAAPAPAPAPAPAQPPQTQKAPGRLAQPPAAQTKIPQSDAASSAASGAAASSSTASTNGVKGDRQMTPQPAQPSFTTPPNSKPRTVAEVLKLQQAFKNLPVANEASFPAVPSRKSAANAAANHAARNQANLVPDPSHRDPAPVPPSPENSTHQPSPTAAVSTKLEEAPQTPSSPTASAIELSGQDSPVKASSVSGSKAQTKDHPTSSNSTDVTQPAASLSVRVSLDRLERMDNQVGELAINRNGLSLQQEQLQRAARDLTHRFSRFQSLVEHLRETSDQVLIAPTKHHLHQAPKNQMTNLSGVGFSSTFDALEMDQYSAIYSQLQSMLEEVVQIEESVDDVVLFTGQSNRTLQDQRQMLNQLRHELMWARMLPLGEVLNRFPRVLRDLSTKFQKSVGLKLFGTSVLVDRAVLEKLYDPLLHLLRNAFDHGIESPHHRQELGKPAQGTIEIRAYHQGNKTMIEIRDDGAGLNLQNIQRKALEKGLISADILANATPSQIFELIFEPGFSTAQKVSEISGRGVGLDIVRSRLRALQGSVMVTSLPGKGTTFTLCLPLTLTIAKLLVCSVGSTAIALPSDSIEEIVVPKGNQVRQSANQRFLSWREQIVPVHPLSSLMEYNCPVQETSLSRALAAAPMPREWALPLLVLRREQDFVALEINRLVTEQELVIKPFSKAIAPPGYAYGCTILGDGTLLPVIDGYVLIDQVLGKRNVSTQTTQFTPDFSKPIDLIVSDSQSPPESSKKFKTLETPQILVVDDAATLRRTLALTLQRAGYRVIQARDGREAIEQLEQSQSVHLVICDIEMPNMNGFEFLNYRRQHNDLNTIPVAMLTSRSNDKHRQLALHLGANAYFTKPYTEQDFLESLTSILKSPADDKPEPRLSVALGARP